MLSFLIQILMLYNTLTTSSNTVTSVPNVALIIAQSLNPGELTYGQPELDLRETFIVVCRALARPSNIASHVNMHYIGAIIVAYIICATLEIFAKACLLQLPTHHK